MTHDFSNLHFHFVDGCASSGKTRAALKAIDRGVRLGERYILAQPTIRLIGETEHCAKAAYPSTNWRSITSLNTPGHTHSEFTKAINATSTKGEVLIITHATLLQCWHIAGKADWTLIVDEIPSVDESFKANLSMTWDFWTQHLETTANASSDKILDVRVKSGSLSLAKAYARNQPNDDVIKVTQPLWKMLVNSVYDVCINRADYQTAGFKGNAQLHAHALLMPSVLSGWKRVTIMGANFKQSLLYMIWGNKGVVFDADTRIKVTGARHDRKTGARCRIHYITERNWSKELRKRAGVAQISEALSRYITGRHIWTANKDVSDNDWKIPNGTRLSTSSHGLNDYRDHTTAIFMAALNDMTPHFSWLEKVHGIDPLEVSKAKAMETAYQMALRTNLRDPDGTDEVTIIVADRRTADYLCSLLPSSKLKYLDLGIKELGEPARDRSTKAPAQTAAERKRLDRDRKTKRKAALDRLQQTVSATNSSLSPVLTMQESIYSRNVGQFSYACWSDVRSEMHALWKNTITNKHENLLLSGAIFASTDQSATVKGKDAFDYVQMLQLDFDDSDLDPETLKLILADVRHFTYNSFSNGKNGQLRYRVVIPLVNPVDIDVYHLLWDMVADRLEEAGYNTGSTKHHDQKESGLDRSKRTPVSFFYLPAQAAIKAMSFWIENWRADILDPYQWIERAPPEPVEYAAIAPVDNATPDLQRLRAGLKENATAANDNGSGAKVEKAICEWQSTTPGNGNANFFRLASKLRAAGYNASGITNVLHLEHATSGTDATDRKRQIPSILSAIFRT